MDQLREQLKLPQIGGELVASYGPSLNYKTKELEDSFSWRISFCFWGWDRRYNPACGSLYKDDIQKFIASLEEALQIMQVLESQSFTGTYSKTIEKSSYSAPRIEVQSSNGRVSAIFRLSSSTGNSFCKILSSSEIAVCIEELKTVPQKGEQMIETLKSLTVGLVKVEQKQMATQGDFSCLNAESPTFDCLVEVPFAGRQEKEQLQGDSKLPAIEQNENFGGDIKPTSEKEKFEPNLLSLETKPDKPLEIQKSYLNGLIKDSLPALKVFAFKVVVKDYFGYTQSQVKCKAQYFTEDLSNGVTLDMVSIPGGSFMMGAPEGEGYGIEEPQHKVTVKPFFMGKYLVTQKQWKAIASLPKIQRDLKADPSKFKGDDLPVERVSWEDAVEFCARLSKKTGREYRLPSEAEWEYACRAGTTTPFHFGETITGDLANYLASDTYANEPQGEYREKTTPAYSFPSNAFGLYDMHGNVWEWCEDDWHSSYENAPTDGSAWLSGNSNKKVSRGGSWGSYPKLCRSAFRNNPARDDRDADIGFRVVCVAPRQT